MLPHNTALERRELFCGGWLVLSSKVHTHHITFTQSQACPTQDDKQGDRGTDSWKITHIPRVDAQQLGPSKSCRRIAFTGAGI